jgi:hypothetical protein
MRERKRSEAKRSERDLGKELWRPPKSEKRKQQQQQQIPHRS